MRAWQRQIRDREAEHEQHENLFGRYWDSLDLSRPVVQAITPATAAVVIERYEWMRCMPAIVSHCFGIYYDGVLAGAVVYSPEYAENLGVWDSYGFTGKLALLARGACVHWAPPHAGSHLIRRSMDLLPPHLEVVTATVDAFAGEVGTIYQACGFTFVGVMSQGGRAAVRGADGKLVNSRQVRRMYGRSDRATLEAIGLEVVPQIRKGRYFAFRGSHGQQKRNRSTIAHLVKPYPKRAGEGSSSDPSSFHEEGAGAVPAPRSTCLAVAR